MKRRMQSSARAGAQEGVMLIEALVANLNFTLGVVALMGLQANSIAQLSAAKYRTDASYLVSQIMGRMWVDQSNITKYQSPGYTGRAGWDTLVTTTLPQGAATIPVAGLPPAQMVTVAITWKQPQDPVTHSYGATARMNASMSP
jgi:type IV pilus assembly protein PilV